MGEVGPDMMRGGDGFLVRGYACMIQMSKMVVKQLGSNSCNAPGGSDCLDSDFDA